MLFISNINGLHGCTSIRLVKDIDTEYYQLHFDVKGNRAEGGMIEGTLPEFENLCKLLGASFAIPKPDFLGVETLFQSELDKDHNKG